MSPPRAEGYCVQERFCFSRLLVASLAHPDSQHCVFLQLSDHLQFFSSTIYVISFPSLTYGQSQPSVDDFLGFSLSVFGAGKAGPTHKLVKTLVKQHSPFHSLLPPRNSYYYIWFFGLPQSTSCHFDRYFQHNSTISSPSSNSQLRAHRSACEVRMIFPLCTVFHLAALNFIRPFITQSLSIRRSSPRSWRLAVF